jgi:hypothetical protein
MRAPAKAAGGWDRRNVTISGQLLHHLGASAVGRITEVHWDGYMAALKRSGSLRAESSFMTRHRGSLAALAIFFTRLY